MTGPLRSLKINYGDYATVESIEPWSSVGWDVQFSCFKVPMLFATKPDWKIGDRIKITFERMDDALPR